MASSSRFRGATDLDAARTPLQGLLRPLGVTDVTVTFTG